MRAVGGLKLNHGTFHCRLSQIHANGLKNTEKLSNGHDNGQAIWRVERINTDLLNVVDWCRN
jgi:hypothetical protein